MLTFHLLNLGQCCLSVPSSYSSVQYGLFSLFLVLQKITNVLRIVWLNLICLVYCGLSGRCCICVSQQACRSGQAGQTADRSGISRTSGDLNPDLRILKFCPYLPFNLTSHTDNHPVTLRSYAVRSHCLHTLDNYIPEHAIFLQIILQVCHIHFCNSSNLFQAEYGGLDSAASQIVDTRIIAEPIAPIAIVRSSFDGPLPAFRYVILILNRVINFS